MVSTSGRLSLLLFKCVEDTLLHLVQLANAGMPLRLTHEFPDGGGHGCAGKGVEPFHIFEIILEEKNVELNSILIALKYLTIKIFTI